MLATSPPVAVAELESVLEPALASAALLAESCADELADDDPPPPLSWLSSRRAEKSGTFIIRLPISSVPPVVFQTIWPASFSS